MSLSVGAHAGDPPQIDKPAGEQGLRAAATDFASAKWERMGNDDGIEVYKWEVPDSGVLAFRGVGVVNATVPKIASVLFDSARQKEWVPELGDFHDVRVIAAREKIQYFKINTPFIVKNRDFVIHGGVDLDKESRTLLVWFHSVEDPAAPPTAAVRGDIRAGQYKLTEIDGGLRTQVEVMVHLDPKGSVPKWLFNLVQKNYPHDTIVGIRRQSAKSDVYEHPEVVAALKR
jgi:hypothetical protein